MLKPAELTLPTTLAVGNNRVLLEPDARSSLAFINGFQAGHLTYMAYGKRARLYDTDLILLMVARQNTRPSSIWFNAGYLVGYLATITAKGVYIPTDRSFDEGCQEGKQAYLYLSKSHIFTISELCSLIVWRHQGHNSSFHGGYIAGFLESLAENGKGGK